MVRQNAKVVDAYHPFEVGLHLHASVVVVGTLQHLLQAHKDCWVVLMLALAGMSFAEHMTAPQEEHRIGPL